MTAIPAPPAALPPALAAVMTLLEGQQVAAALRACEAIVARWPDQPAAWQMQGHASLLSGNAAAALRCLDHALGLRPDHLPTLKMAVRAARQLPDPTRALQLSIRLSQLQPDDAEATLIHASSLLDLGRSADAAAVLEQAAVRWPGMAAAWFALAIAREDHGDPAGAAQALQRTLALQPDHVEAWVNLGLLRQSLGDVDGALHAHAQAVRLRPQVFGRVAMALCSQRSGEVWINTAALRAELDRLVAGSPVPGAVTSKCGAARA